MTNIAWHDDLSNRLAHIEEQLAAPLPIEPAVTPLPVTETNPAQPAPVFYAGTAQHATVPVTSISTVVLLSNPNRRRFILYNDSKADMFIMFGPTATTSRFSFRIAPNDYYQPPLGCYTGVISAVRGSGTGNLQVTEITA